MKADKYITSLLHQSQHGTLLALIWSVVSLSTTLTSLFSKFVLAFPIADKTTAIVAEKLEMVVRNAIIAVVEIYFHFLRLIFCALCILLHVQSTKEVLE